MDDPAIEDFAGVYHADCLYLDRVRAFSLAGEVELSRLLRSHRQRGLFRL